jgi:hypothetical protein
VRARRVVSAGAAPAGPEKALRPKVIFANEINLIWPVQSLAQKYSYSVFQKNMIVSPHPVPA